MAVVLPAPVDELERIPVRRPNLRARLADADLSLGVLAALVGTVTVAIHLTRTPSFAGDEGIYVEQAWSVLHGHVVPYTYTYDHPFLGWAQLAPLIATAEALHIGGPLSLGAARSVMVLYAFATLLLTYGVARRCGVRMPYAALAVVLLGTCPLFVVNARQVYLDNVALPWVLAAFFVALSPTRRQWSYTVAGLLFAVGVLSKETVLLFLPALVYVVWTRAYRPTRAMCVTSFAVLGTLAVGVYPLFAALRNELLPGRHHVSLWTNGVLYQLATRKGSGALWQSGSPRYQLLADWLGWDRLLLCAGAVGCVVALVAVRRLRAPALCFAFWALPVLKPGGYLPAMYVIAALPFAAVLVGGITDGAGRWLAQAAGPVTRSRRSRLVAGCAAAAVAMLALAVYHPGLTRLLSGGHAGGVTADVERYVEQHAPHGDNIVVDDSYWTDLVRAGYPQPWHGVISYYKFDLDQVTSSRTLPHGWQDIDYVVVTQEMRANASGNLALPRLSAAIAHSSVVATYGSGQDAVQVRRVEPTPYNHTGGPR